MSWFSSYTNPRETTGDSFLDSLLLTLSSAYSSLHQIPFTPMWTNEELMLMYHNLLQSMEHILLTSWKGLQQRKRNELSKELVVWDQEQSRHHNSILQQYYQFYESLALWGVEVPVTLRGNGQWSDYLRYSLYSPPQLIRSHFQHAESFDPKIVRMLLHQYLNILSTLAYAEPYLLCTDFFSWLSQYTQISYFLPQISFQMDHPQEEMTSTLPIVLPIENEKSLETSVNLYYQWLKDHL